MAKKQSKKQNSSPSGPPAAKKDRPDRDRRVRQADRIARILKVLELIQSRGRWTTRAIAEEIECSERTVYRDLDVLRFAGIPYYREGVQQFIRVRPDYRFPALSLTDDEVLGLSLATVATNAPGLNVTAGAGPTTRKLAAVSRAETQELIEDALRLVSVLDLKLVDHSRHHETIKTVQLALLQGKQISGLYQSPYEPAPVKLKLHPYRLFLLKNAWYIIGRMTDEASPKTFRIARFRTLRMLDESALVPDDFDLKTYFGNAWAVYRGEQSYRVELKFTPDAGKIVTETIWHPTQHAKTHKDGSVTLTFRSRWMVSMKFSTGFFRGLGGSRSSSQTNSRLCSSKRCTTPFRCRLPLRMPDPPESVPSGIRGSNVAAIRRLSTGDRGDSNT